MVAIKEKSLIGSILGLSKLLSDQYSYDIASQGMETLLTQVLEADCDFDDLRVDKRYVESLIDELDEKLSKQMDEIIHNSVFQALESPWRSLKLLTDRTDFNENIKVEVLSVSKNELLEDFEDAADIIETGLYRKVYTDEFGQYGGDPYGVIIGNYYISPSAPDMNLLSHMSSLSAMTHAPFITSASEAFFGLEDFSELPELKQLEAMFEGPQYLNWRNFRSSDDARNVGLTLPRFMLRRTYGENIPVSAFNYKESINNKSEYLWGNAAFAYATRLNNSFAKYRWCPNIIGPQSGGEVADLPIDIVNDSGTDKVFGPVELKVSDRKEFELSELGFIPFTLRKDSDSAVFFSSNSTQLPKKFTNDDEGRQAEINFRLGTQLPYLFIVNRLAHYIKVLQRENLGSWKSKTELETELNKWIRQYVADQDNPSAATRSQRPLRKAAISVSDIDTEVGWYSVGMEVTPHFKFMGASFTLSLTSILERA
ncbi:type VI secretion system contractile sheath large subunit [Psychromonas sp. MB-3u-54]|uniref:type VI secretion system contractile sheath large subunit n=1 Tax=Psychromonas sp. MB-3u-54 TaxID=2058319 RepID=UPI000C33520F|nr:type VI secretion system contractile sheath large subunit [Psychromonas sp. MB-3u-54]PKH01797.1 type VI secretion system contractile sheath large subunit [Psychromonas sp. MB-3u-54]